MIHMYSKSKCIERVKKNIVKKIERSKKQKLGRNDSRKIY